MKVNTVSQVIGLTDQDIAFVSDLARKAGCLAREMRDGVDINHKDVSDPQDKVTAADLALSKMIIEQLKERFPNDVVVSEEDAVHPKGSAKERVWLIDPIDGTDNYIRNDGQYAVMIGVLINAKPVFGWVFAPALDTLYLGGPGYGAWKEIPSQKPVPYDSVPAIADEPSLRIAMGFRDRTSHPWVKDHPKIQLVKIGSVGLKVTKILEGEADIFVHLSGKLKTWDTAGPAAIALGAGLEVGGMDSDELLFPLPSVRQEFPVIVGRPGALAWSREHLQAPACDNGG